MSNLKCVAGCKIFAYHEAHHHKDCPHYPESLSKLYDEMSDNIAKVQLEKQALSNRFEDYLDGCEIDWREKIDNEEILILKKEIEGYKRIISQYEDNKLDGLVR